MGLTRIEYCVTGHVTFEMMAAGGLGKSDKDKVKIICLGDSAVGKSKYGILSIYEIFLHCYLILSFSI